MLTNQGGKRALSLPKTGPSGAVRHRGECEALHSKALHNFWWKRGHFLAAATGKMGLLPSASSQPAGKEGGFGVVEVLMPKVSGGAGGWQAGVWLIKSSSSVEKQQICLNSLSPGSWNGPLPGAGFQGDLYHHCCQPVSPLRATGGSLAPGNTFLPPVSSPWLVQPGDSGDTVSHCPAAVTPAGNVSDSWGQCLAVPGGKERFQGSLQLLLQTNTQAEPGKDFCSFHQ